MAINRVEVFNSKPVKASSIEKNPLFEKIQKKNIETEKRLSPPLQESTNPKPGSKIDIIG